MNDPLAKLIAKADSVAESASALVRQSIRDIQGEISVMSKELRLGVVAKDREKVEKMILRRMADLSVKLNELMETQNELAAKAAAKSAGRLTGMEVKYDARRAEAITALVTPKQGENLAAVFTDQMGAHAIGALRYATVKVMREQAVQGGGMKAMARALEREWLKQAHSSENFRFKDAGGHVWDTRTYMQMNVRTNAMRVYNDCLVDNIAQATGGDLARISTGGDPNCQLCSPWEGVIVSISGKTKGLPTYEQAREAGCFHPNCVHTLEYVDEIADEEEIELQKAHPVNTEEEATDPDAADERRYAIDQDRYRKAGMSAEEARVAVDRDNLAASIRHGLIRDDAREIVDRMTDAQVTALCPNGNPPTFEPTKGTKKNQEPERWNHGSRGGVVHIKRDADLAHILSVTKADKAAESRQSDENGHRSARNAPDAWKPTTALERATDALMRGLGVKHASKELDPMAANTKFNSEDESYRHNCQRCVPCAEVRFRGYDVTAAPRMSDVYSDPLSLVTMTQRECNFPCFKDPQVSTYRKREDIERAMAEMPDGARVQITCIWKRKFAGGHKGVGHTFMALKSEGKISFVDPQNGDKDVSKYFKMIETRGHLAKIGNEFARIDNLEFNDRIKRAVEVLR